MRFHWLALAWFALAVFCVAAGGKNFSSNYGESAGAMFSIAVLCGLIGLSYLVAALSGVGPARSRFKGLIAAMKEPHELNKALGPRENIPSNRPTP